MLRSLLILASDHSQIEVTLHQYMPKSCEMYEQILKFPMAIGTFLRPIN